MLIGRTEQKTVFKEAFLSSKSELVVVYGRRRVGKTFLVKAVLGKNIDFEMTGIKEGNLKNQLENFSDKLSEFAYNDVPIEQPPNWKKAFSMLKTYLSKKKGKRKSSNFFSYY